MHYVRHLYRYRITVPSITVYRKWHESVHMLLDYNRRLATHQVTMARGEAHNHAVLRFEDQHSA